MRREDEEEDVRSYWMTLREKKYWKLKGKAQETPSGELRSRVQKFPA